jgi:hypothetical protein
VSATWTRRSGTGSACCNKNCDQGRACPARLHPHTSKDCAISVESTREQWDEVMPVSDPIAEFPSNGWSMFLLAVTLVGVVGYAVLMSGGAL